MSANGRPRHGHGRAPQMSAAMRKAFEAFEVDGPSPGDRLVQISVPERDATPILSRLFDYFGNSHKPGHPVREALDSCARMRDDESDPDAGPLLEAISALPEGQMATLFSLMDLACAFAAIEGMALGAAYVDRAERGFVARARTRPRR